MLLRDDEKFAFVSDGLKGITVLNIEDLADVKVVLSIPLLGSASNIVLR